MLDRRHLFGASLAALLAPAIRAGAAPRTTELFFYPAPLVRPDGDVVFSPVTLVESQVTTGFPEIDEMAGVVAMLCWSDLSPGPDRLDTGPFERILDYWGRRGRKVVIGVVTVGFPMLRGDTSRTLASPTPQWVLDRCSTYRQSVRVLGPARTAHPYPMQAPALLPVYWDPHFQEAVAGMVRGLARLDGHPALSKVRVSLGIETEDNPTFDGLRAAMPGWSNLAWIAYCRRMTDCYLSEFRTTGSEFDIDRLGYIAAIGTRNDRNAASALLDHLIDAKVFLAMNGLDPATARAWLTGDADGPARSIDDLVEARARGDAGIGLETVVFAGRPTSDIEPIADLLARIRPDRLVLNADVAAALASKPRDASESLFTPKALVEGADNFRTAVRGLRLECASPARRCTTT